MLVPDGTIELSNGPRMNRSRPAVNAMFASAARWFGDQVIAVVLSGMLDDGAVGAALVAQAGGTVIVQDPDEAEQASMPQAALAAARGAITRPSSELGSVVQEMLGPGGLISSPRPGRAPATKVNMDETGDLKYLAARETALTRLACPDCGGALAEVECRRSPIIAAMSGTSSAYRCHVGHQFGPQALAAAQADSAETKLWTAVAALEETAALAGHLAHIKDAEAAQEHRGTADWAAELDRAVRSQIQQAPRQSDQPVS